MLANQFSQINLSNPHALIEENQKKINKWLEIFEYDFSKSKIIKFIPKDIYNENINYLCLRS